MESPTPLPFVVQLDARSPDDVIDAAVLEAFSSRRFPVARTLDLARVRSSAPLLPPTASPFLETQRGRHGHPPGLRERLDAAHGSARERLGGRLLTALATSVALAKSILAAASRGAVAPAPEDTACFAFWHRGKYGATPAQSARCRSSGGPTFAPTTPGPPRPRSTRSCGRIPRSLEGARQFRPTGTMRLSMNCAHT